MHTAGFEPARIAPPELESGALDHSAKYATISIHTFSLSCLGIIKFFIFTLYFVKIETLLLKCNKVILTTILYEHWCKP